MDIDLVCELTGKNPLWTQYHLKQTVGNRLKANELYKNMLEDEGRRCWTLIYAESANYHMDILPSIVSSGYNTVLEKAFSSKALESDYDSLAIRITDRKLPNYKTDTIAENWMKSNPFGYGMWFFNAADIFTLKKSMVFSNAVHAVPKYNKEKLPLQRVVQILKRHRDIMFNGDDDKPISIIITTLSALAYQKEALTFDALINIIDNMGNFIEKRYDFESGKYIKWIPNPVNPEENFADKWIEHPQREVNFYYWLNQIKNDVHFIIKQRGLQNICNAMKKPFGESAVTRAFSSLGERGQNLRENGLLKMASTTGVLGASGTITVASHNFHGGN